MSNILIRPSQEPRAGYVYVVAPVGHNVYKIGCTVNLETRIARMKRKHDFKLEYVTAVPSSDYVALEDALHRRYAGYRLDGEWFALMPEHIEFIKGLAS